ncbi:MAG TPA: GNAT family N-acetyltransferase [Burkholderiales bacterium]
MIKRCVSVRDIGEVINDGAQAYRGVIPADRWHEPYMPREDLEREIAAGVTFLGFYERDRLLGVMGSQPVADVTLIRHAYTRTEAQGRGVGSALLKEILSSLEGRPVLIGTWKAAAWAIRFYEGRGFTLVSEAEKERLLRRYWTIPERQIEESVVLRN